MFRLTSKITIKTALGNNLRFHHVNHAEIITSIDNLTDTCKIILPRIYMKGDKTENNLTKLIKRDDEISVELGYDDNFKTLFTGYIKSISTKSPITIECENETWKLKQIKLQAKYYPQLKLSDLLKEYMPEYTVKTTDYNLGEMRINGGTTLTRLFDTFMSKYPLRFFFRDGIFYANSISELIEESGIKTIKFREGKNYISDNLTYTLAEDVKIQVITAVDAKNEYLQAKEPKGMEEGEIRKYYFSGAKNVSELVKYAKDISAMLKVNKMKGDLTAFGEPMVKKGDFIHLLDDENTERNDKKFLVEAVKYTFGEGGYRQVITLGKEII